MIATACADRVVTVCAGIGVAVLSLPESASVAVGSSFVAMAGASFDSCLGQSSDQPPRQFLWQVSDSTVVNVVSLDSVHARIIGLRVGSAIVTPAYRATGGSAPPVRVTVVP